MKKLAIVALAFAASLLAADYSGSYTGQGGFESAKYGSVPATAQLTLLQSGSTVTGTLKLGGGAVVPISSGTVSNNQITFAADNGTATLVANGTQLTGKYTTSTGDVLDVVFTKQ